MKAFYINMLAVLALLFSGAALADDHGNMDKGAKGKEKAAQMKGGDDAMKEDMDAGEKEADDSEDEGDDEAMEAGEEDGDDMAGEKPMKEKGDKPKGLEKKEGAPQAGKGSEKGQEMREEKSKAWWKFWE